MEHLLNHDSNKSSILRNSSDGIREQQQIVLATQERTSQSISELPDFKKMATAGSKVDDDPYDNSISPKINNSSRIKSALLGRSTESNLPVQQSNSGFLSVPEHSRSNTSNENHSVADDQSFYTAREAESAGISSLVVKNMAKTSETDYQSAFASSHVS